MSLKLNLHLEVCNNTNIRKVSSKLASSFNLDCYEKNTLSRKIKKNCEKQTKL